MRIWRRSKTDTVRVKLSPHVVHPRTFGGPPRTWRRRSFWSRGGTRRDQGTPGHAHIGVTASVYAHVRLRPQRDAIDLLGNALRNPAKITGEPDDGDEPPLCAAPVR